MSRAHNPRVIEELRDRIAHLEGSAAKKAIVLPFGVREMDGRLPGGGLPYGALHEIAGGGAGTVDGAAATEFVLSYDGKPSYVVSIMEFRDGLVAHETQYFSDRFEPSSSRANLVEH
jgi:hypothetical protein